MKVLLIAQGASVLGHREFAMNMADCLASTNGGRLMIIDGGFSALEDGRPDIYPFSLDEKFVAAGAGMVNIPKAQKGLDSLNWRDYDTVAVIADGYGMTAAKHLQFPKPVHIIPCTIDADIVGVYCLGFESAVCEAAEQVSKLLWSKSRTYLGQTILVPIRVMGGRGIEHTKALVKEVMQQVEAHDRFSVMLVDGAESAHAIAAGVFRPLADHLDAHSRSRAVGLIIPDIVCDTLKKDAEDAGVVAENAYRLFLDSMDQSGGSEALTSMIPGQDRDTLIKNLIGSVTGEQHFKALIEPLFTALRCSIHDAERIRTEVLGTTLGEVDASMAARAVAQIDFSLSMQVKRCFNNERSEYFEV